MTITDREEYRQDLLRVLTELDVDKFKEVWTKWRKRGRFTADIASPIGYQIAMYKMASVWNAIPKDSRDKAEKWLLKNGFTYSECKINEMEEIKFQ